MKNALFTFVISFLIYGTGFSQQKLIDNISDDACKCANKKIKKKGLSSEDIFKNCLSETVQAYESKLRKEFDSDFFEDGDALENFGMQIAANMMKNCDAFVQLAIDAGMGEDAEAAELVKRAEQKNESGDYEGAIEDYTTAIKMDPLADYLNDRGLVYFSMGEYYHAISDVLRAIETEPEPTYYYNVAYTLYTLGDNDEALEYVNTTLEMDEEACDAYNLKGLIYSRAPDYDSCIVYFRAGFNCDPEDEVKAYNIAYVLCKQSEYPEAIEWFKKADKMGYDKRDLDNDIGNSFYNDEKYVEALPYYEKCLEEDTSYVSYYNLGTCHFQLKDYDKALELLSVAESKEDDEEVLGFISDIHFEREDYEKAMEYAEKALELNRRNASRYDQRAKIYEKMGEEKEAINNYLTSISLYPQDCAIYKKLTALYNAIGDTAKASEFEKKAKELMCEEE